MKSSYKSIVRTRIFRSIAFFGLVFFLLGIGGGDGNNSGGSGLPLTQKNFSAMLTDGKGIQTTANRMTWEGKNYLKGQYGNATITVPFAKIQQVTISATKEANPNTISAQIQLKAGKTIQLSLDRTTKVYADTDFGQFEIFIKDLQRMDFKS